MVVSFFFSSPLYVVLKCVSAISQALKIEYCSLLIMADLCKILHTSREELAQALEETSLCFQNLKQVCRGLLDTSELT